jgi:hypothetical protein
LDNLLWILLAVMCIPYLAMPLLLWRSQHFFPAPTLTRHLPGFLPPPVKSHFDDLERAFADLGFEGRADGLSRDHFPDTDLYLRILVDEKKATVATVSALLSHGEGAQVFQRFVELMTRSETGLEVTTHNCDLLGTPVEWPKRISLALPPQTSAGDMAALHERATTEHIGSTGRILPTQGNELEAARQAMHDELRQQVELGGLRIDEEDGLFRPTLAGAVVMAWGSLWPVTMIRRALRRRRTRHWRRAMSS